MGKIDGIAKLRQKVAWTEGDITGVNEKLQWGCTEYGRLRSDPPKNPFQAVKEWTRVAEALIQYTVLAGEIMESYRRMIEAFENDEYANSGRPWTEVEDQILVEAKASGDSLLSVSLNLHRSPLACTTRLSELVGVQRKVTNVNGKRIEGVLNEEDIDGTFTGKIFHQ